MALFARQNGPQALGASDQWDSLFAETGAGTGIPLGTARWMSPNAAVEKFAYRDTWLSGKVWIGEAFNPHTSPLGYTDDRHVCLVSGSRGGKGVGVIVPNLCYWPGSAIVVDPKGENATVTAQRRGAGSAYTHPMGQKVCILDPFGEVQLPPELKARYNPLDAIDPKSDFAIDDAGRVAAALVVVENRNDPYWEEAARNLIKGLILHVLSLPSLERHRNLLTVRRFLTQGDWLSIERMRKDGDDGEMPSAFTVLWSRMRRNPAFNGVVAGVGEQMISMADKQRSGVLESARTNTEFLDSIPMQRLLAQSDFDLGELKTNPRGLTIYLTLPTRYMETHYRWLRLMISLAVGEMERIKGRPLTGHPTLFLLDEFAGLKRMEVVENAAAQAAGFGIKFFFVVQNLPQIEDLYEKSWETFLGNSGLKMFFQIDDDFSRSYLARQLGELETTRETRSGSQSQSRSDSTTEGDTSSYSTGHATSRRPFLHFRTSKQSSSGYSNSHATSRSRGTAASMTDGWGEAVHKRSLLNPDEIGRMLARIDDSRRPGYPGLVLALIPGEHPLLVRRVNYFAAPWFAGCFDPHPDHPPPPTLAELAAAKATQQSAPLSGSVKKSRPPWNSEEMIGVTAITLAALVGIGVGIYYWQKDPTPASISPSPPATAGSLVAGATMAARPPDPQRPPEPQQSSEPPPSAAYTQGVADWRELKAWVDAQAGDRRAGVDYWAANRSAPGHVTCATAAEGYSGNAQAFNAGCQDAKRVLDPIDARRADPQYRTGFNDEAKRFPFESGPARASLPRYATVGALNLNLREGPGPSYASLAVVPSGTKVKILKDADDGWEELEVLVDSQTLHGFSNGKFLTPIP